MGERTAAVPAVRKAVWAWAAAATMTALVIAGGVGIVIGVIFAAVMPHQGDEGYEGYEGPPGRWPASPAW